LFENELLKITSLRIYGCIASCNSTDVPSYLLEKEKKKQQKPNNQPAPAKKLFAIDVKNEVKKMGD